MSEYVKLATGAGDQFLAALAEGQETFLKSVSALSSSWTPLQAPVAVPAFAAELPTPKEMVEANYAFVSKLLKQQKDFTDKFFAATAAK
ncbi:MAG TPA: hypothetical protein VGQ37_06205 [Vicinamibacterales bacterium]|jgi:hypothetical protein|nr:hypothetical protein [Vicinamibacterales bacterium]